MALLKANSITGINSDFKTYIYVIRQLVWRKNSSSMTVATSFSSNPFSDLKESIIHFHRWLVRGFCFAIYSLNGQMEQVDLQRLTESVFEVGLKTFKWIFCGLKLKSNKFEQPWLFMNVRGHHMVSSRFLINDMVFTIAKLIWIARKWLSCYQKNAIYRHQDFN